MNALDSIGAYPSAKDQLDSLIKRDSLNYAFWYRKAEIQESLHDTIGALKSYRYAIRIYPSPDALLGAANLMAEQKNDTALALSKQVHTLRLGREYTAHCEFIDGIFYARTGDNKKAMVSFDACIRNDLYYMEAYMEKGFILFEESKTVEAKKIFETVIIVKNTYADGYYWLAKCAEKLHDVESAKTHYQKALTLDPTLIEAAAALKRLG